MIELIRARMAAENISQRQLSDAIGVPVRTLQGYLKGELPRGVLVGALLSDWLAGRVRLDPVEGFQPGDRDWRQVAVTMARRVQAVASEFDRALADRALVDDAEERSAEVLTEESKRYTVDGMMRATNARYPGETAQPVMFRLYQTQRSRLKRLSAKVGVGEAELVRRLLDRECDKVLGPTTTN